MHALHAQSVLRRDGRQNTGAVASQSGDRLQVGLDAGATAGVAACTSAKGVRRDLPATVRTWGGGVCSNIALTFSVTLAVEAMVVGVNWLARGSEVWDDADRGAVDESEVRSSAVGESGGPRTEDVRRVESQEALGNRTIADLTELSRPKIRSPHSQAAYRRILASGESHVGTLVRMVRCSQSRTLPTVIRRKVQVIKSLSGQLKTDPAVALPYSAT